MLFNKSALQVLKDQVKALRKLAESKKSRADALKRAIDDVQKQIVLLNQKRAALILELETFNASADALEEIAKGAANVKEVIS